MKHKKYLIINLIMTAGFLLASCGGSGSGGTRNVGPVVSIIDPGLIEERAQAQLGINATDPDGTIREIQWVQLTGPTISFIDGDDTIDFVVPEVDADTDFSFSIAVVDNNGAITTADLNGTILNVNRAPEVSDITLVVEMNSSIEFTLTADDPDGDTLSFSVIMQPQTGTIEALDSTNTFYRYTPDNQSLSDDQITFEVSDGELTASALVIFDLVPQSKLKNLLLSEVSASNYWDDNRWIELYNGTQDAINLGDYSLRAGAIDQTNYSYLSTQLYSLPEKIIQPGTYVVVQYRFLHNFSYLAVANTQNLIVIQNDSESRSPMWSNSGFVELVDKAQLETIDFVQFGNSYQLPLSNFHWNFESQLGMDPDNLGMSLVKTINKSGTNSSYDWQFVRDISPTRPNSVNYH